MRSIIDVHAHFVSRDLIAEASRQGAQYGLSIEHGGDGLQRVVFADGTRLRPFFPELCDLDVRLPKLKSWGIDRQFLSTWTDMVGDLLPPREAARLARLQNETLADGAARNPDVFEAMGTVPLQDVGACLAELDHLSNVLGMRSIELSTNINGRDIDGPEYRPFWKRVCDLGLLVLLHPGFVPLGPQRLDKYFLNNLVGFPTDTTVAAARLMFSGLLTDLPDLKICLAHGGGFLPYQIGRFDRGFDVHPACQATLPVAPSKVMRSFYFDTLTHGDAALSFLFDTVDRGRILYGTDYPFEMLDEAGPARVTRLRGLDAAEVDGALGGNVRQILRSRTAFHEAVQPSTSKSLSA